MSPSSDSGKASLFLRLPSYCRCKSPAAARSSVSIHLLGPLLKYSVSTQSCTLPSVHPCNQVVVFLISAYYTFFPVNGGILGVR
jgi:hypothetical protein